MWTVDCTSETCSEVRVVFFYIFFCPSTIPVIVYSDFHSNDPNSGVSGKCAARGSLFALGTSILGSVTLPCSRHILACFPVLALCCCEDLLLLLVCPLLVVLLVELVVTYVVRAELS